MSNAQKDRFSDHQKLQEALERYFEGELSKSIHASITATEIAVRLIEVVSVADMSSNGAIPKRLEALARRYANSYWTHLNE